jgi:CO/xanthine dehydrogenase Mo-binding subunit
MLVGKVLRSPYAHARITHIDTGKAAALPGVMAIITGKDLPSMTLGPAGPHGRASAREYYLSHEILARDKVLFHGHAVAAVAATSHEIAEDALDLTQVEYEELPHVLDPLDAMQPGAVLLHHDLHTQTPSGEAPTPSNVAEHLEMGRGDVEQGFAEAEVVVEETFRTQVVHQGYIEPDSEAAWVHEDGSVVVWANTQTTFTQRHDLAMLLGIPVSKIRVVPTEVGGAFGGKESIRVSALCVALSRKAGLPVRMTLSREEVLRATGPGNATVSTIKVGARRDGTITAIQARIVYDAGAYPGAPLRSAIRRVFSHYRTPNLKIDAYDVVTNKPHVAAYRAPGATPTNFALESVIDAVGAALDMDPLAFRLMNVSRTGDPMPDGVHLSSVSLENLLQRVQQHPCWTTPLTSPNHGRGIAVGMWTMPGGTTSCHITLSADGSVTLVLGTVDLSATRTSLAMVAAEALGLDLEDVRVVVGDTDMVAYSGASAGDKVTYVTSKAILKASHDLLRQLQARAAEVLQASPQDILYERKRFWIRNAPAREVTLADLALRTIRGEEALMGYGSASETVGSVAIAPNAAVHVADVEVDRETGQVKLLRYTTFQDVGLCVNPDQVEGQMQGGATQGIGWALSEAYTFDARGTLQNANLLDYRLQSSMDVPSISAIVVEMPSSDHPYGIRAVGQVPIVPPAAAIANAIYQATGVRIHALPMTPERVYWALQRAERATTG